MNIVSVVNLALYIPIILVFALCCTFFLISGYQKGFWRSFISLGMSLGSILIGLLLGKLFGWILAGPIAKSLAEKLLTDTDVPLQLLNSIVQSIMQGGLTFVFFGIFLIAALILSKNLSKKIHFAKMDDEPTDQKGLRYAGMGLRFLDAIIVTLVVLIPLYGPLAMTMPIASRFVNIASGNSNATASAPINPSAIPNTTSGVSQTTLSITDTTYRVVNLDAAMPNMVPGIPDMVPETSSKPSTMEQLVTTIEGNPILVIYKQGPASLMVRSLSTVSLGGESIDAAQIMWAIEGTIDRFDAYAHADGQEQADALEELVRFMRVNVVEKSWSYDVLQALRKEMNKYQGVEEDLDLIYALTDTDRNTYRSNGIALLEFIEYALQNEFMTFYRSSDYEALTPEFYEKLGALINHSEQAVALKKILFIEHGDALFAQKQQTADFISQHIPNQPLPKELQKQEAESFMRIFFEKGPINTAEALVRHPKITYEDVKPLLNQQLWSTYIQSGSFFGRDPVKYTEALAVMHTQLANYETAPLKNHTFSQYAHTLLSFNDFLLEVPYTYTFTATDVLLQELIDTVSDELYQSSALDTEKVKQILAQALEEAKKQPGVSGYIYIKAVYDGISEELFVPEQDVKYEDMFQGGGTIIIPGIDEDYTIQVLPNDDQATQPVTPDNGFIMIPNAN